MRDPYRDWLDIKWPRDAFECPTKNKIMNKKIKTVTKLFGVSGEGLNSQVNIYDEEELSDAIKDGEIDSDDIIYELSVTKKYQFKKKLVNFKEFLTEVK